MTQLRAARNWRNGLIIGSVLAMVSALAIVGILIFVLSSVLDNPLDQRGPAGLLALFVAVFGIIAGTFTTRCITRCPPNNMGGREEGGPSRKICRLGSLLLSLLCICLICSIFYVGRFTGEMIEFDRDGDGVFDAKRFKRWEMDGKLFVFWIYGSIAVLSTLTLSILSLASNLLGQLGITTCFRVCAWLFKLAVVLVLASVVSIYVDSSSFFSFLSPPAAGFLAFTGLATLSIGAMVISRMKGDN